MYCSITQKPTICLLLFFPVECCATIRISGASADAARWVNGDYQKTGTYNDIDKYNRGSYELRWDTPANEWTVRIFDLWLKETKNKEYFIFHLIEPRYQTHSISFLLIMSPKLLVFHATLLQ